MISKTKKGLAFLSTFPPRACGIATYTTDLINAIASKFEESYRLIPIPIVDNNTSQDDGPLGKLDILNPLSFDNILQNILCDLDIKLICVEHEFGLFLGQEAKFISFLSDLNAAQLATVVTFHTVLPAPDRTMLEHVSAIAYHCSQIIVMTQGSADILIHNYKIPTSKITVLRTAPI